MSKKDTHKYYYNTEARDEKRKKVVLNVMDKKKCQPYSFTPSKA